MSVIFFNFRNQNFKIEIWFVWLPPPPAYFVSYLSAGGWCFGITLTLILTVKTFPTHFKANYNKLETQNGGGGGSASFGENAITPQICENVKLARFMDLGSSLGIDISTKQNIDED